MTTKRRIIEEDTYAISELGSCVKRKWRGSMNIGNISKRWRKDWVN